MEFLLRTDSTDNISFATGEALLQPLSRDTQKFALKCSAACVARKRLPIYKTPLTVPDKNSKSGRLALVLNELGELTTSEYVGKQGVPEDLLKVVFEDGHVSGDYDLASIRQGPRGVSGRSCQGNAR